MFNTTNTIIGDVTTNGGETNARGNIFGNITVNGGSSFTTTGNLFQQFRQPHQQRRAQRRGRFDEASINGTVTNTGAISVDNGLSLFYGAI